MRMENPREQLREGGEHARTENAPSRSDLALIGSSGAVSEEVDPCILLAPLLLDAASRSLVAARSGASLDSAIGRARIGVHSACSIARDRRVRAEQVILLMKEGWRCASRAHALARDDAESMLARLVTMCVVSYYTPDRS